MPPKSECAQCRQSFRAGTDDELLQKELQHHKESHTPPDGGHSCRVFLLYDGVEEWDMIAQRYYAYGFYLHTKKLK